MPDRTNQHLLDLARSLQTVASYSQLMEVATQAMQRHTRYRDAWLTLFDLEAQLAHVLGGVGVGDQVAAEEAGMLSFPIEEDRLVQEVVRAHRPVVVVDARTDPRPNAELAGALDSRTIVNIPLLLDEQTVGCFGFGTFGDTGPLVPLDEEMEFFSALGGQMSVVIGRLRAEERRREVEAVLLRAQRLDAMGHLAGGVAHDFNNLLTTIFCAVDLARHDLGPDHPASLYLDDVEAAASRGAGLSRQLLAFARRQVVQPHPVDLNQLLEGMRPLLTRLLPDMLQLEVLPGRALGTVMADPGQLEQVLLNLCINARDAMPEGGRLVVETENVRIDEDYRKTHPWARLGRFVLLTVTDSGVGMEAQVAERVFEPFFTTRADDGGTGLGLSVVYGIVDQHEGMVRVYSEPGLGTSFKVYLPIVERSATTVGTKIQRPVRGGEEHILLADDDERVRRVVRNMLVQVGYQVTLAEDGVEALELLGAADPPVDVVLSDVVMPRLDGAELWEEVQRRHPGLPMLIMSGYAANGLTSRFQAHEDLKIVTKPFRTSDLLASVREILDRPRLPRGR